MVMSFCLLNHSLSNLYRFLQSAEMLKPPTPTTSQDEELVEYFPHVLFVHSYAQATDFSKERIELMQVNCSLFSISFPPT